MLQLLLIKKTDQDPGIRTIEDIPAAAKLHSDALKPHSEVC